MGTKIRIPGPMITGHDLDLNQFMANAGYTVLTRKRSKRLWVVTLAETLNTRQHNALASGLVEALSGITAEHVATEPKVIADERYEDVIDECTRRRIRDGFEWPVASGNRFSLSTNAQIKWLGLNASRNDLAYPYKVPMKDNDGFYQIADAAESQMMYGAAVITIDTILSAGTAKKEEITKAAGKKAGRTLAVNYLTANNCTDLAKKLGP